MRVYNFSAGPSMLPEEVLSKAASEMLDYEGSGQSVMEMSHRSKVYDTIIKDAGSLFREIMKIPENYEVLFLQGGASSQFAMVPLNLMKNKKADYVISGEFSTKSYQEATRYGECTVVASTKDVNFSKVPALTEDIFSDDADYIHLCYNNTIYGTKFKSVPENLKAPIVADMSSCILSEPVDVSKFGIIYAGAQKNIGPAGLTVAIVRKDLIGDCIDGTPTMFMYKTHAKAESMYNTPPAYSIYICKLVLEWIKDMGGLDKMLEHNERKCKILYDYLDNSEMFSACAEKDSRSLMNATFVSSSKELDSKFVKESEEAGFVNLKGHRSVGGMRASIYNAMPIEGVEKLVAFMEKFENENK